jgi:hypothetical protein
VSQLFDLVLARALLGAFGALARSRASLTRSLLVVALRRAMRPERPVAAPRSVAEDLLVAFREAARRDRFARSCLPRALALRELLALRGHPARVRLGLDRSPRPRGGHAWVESRGVPVGEPEGQVARYLACETS